MSALITGSDSPKALSVIRSLGKKNIPVTAAADILIPLASLSKYCNGKFQYPSPVTSPEAYISSLVDYISHNPHEVLIPVHSDDTYLIAQFQDRLSRYAKIPLHRYDCIREVNDKGCLMKVAEELDICIPDTYHITRIEDLHSLVSKLEFPVVIKVRNSSGSRGVAYAADEEQLMSRYRQIVQKNRLSLHEFPIIQEYIRGDGYGVSLLFNDGDVRAKCTHKRLREFPTSGGPSTLRESVVHPEMENIAMHLLKYYEWHGLAMVEFKISESDKKPVLLEVNPRIWGSINLSILAGVDFPYLLYQMAKDGDVRPVFNYKTGIQSRNCLGDILSMGSYLAHTGRIKNLFKTRIVPFNDDVISLDDPRPLLRFYKAGISHILNNGHL